MKKQITKFLLILIICAVTFTGFAVKAAATGGTGDASLSSLEISPGTLSPEFSSGCYEYQVEVGEDCDKLLVNAQTTDSGAKLVIAGNSGLKAGVNSVFLNVTAADGVTTAKYTIQVTRGAPQQGGDSIQGGQTQASGSQVGGGIASSPLIMGNRSETASQEPESSKPQDPDETLEDAETVEEGKNLEDGDVPGSGELPEDGTVPVQAASGTVTTAGKTYTLSRPDEAAVPGGFNAIELSVGGQTVPAWQFPSVYEITGMYLVYGTSPEGKTAFYIYDESEGTMITAAEGLLMMGQESQISQNQLRNAQEAYQKSLKGRMMVIIGLSILCFILVIALTASLTRKRHSDDGDQEAFYRKSSYREAYESDNAYEEDDNYSDSYEGNGDYSDPHEDSDYSDSYGDDNGYENLFEEGREEIYEPEPLALKEKVSRESEEKVLEQGEAGKGELLTEPEPEQREQKLENDTAPLPKLGDTEKLAPVKVEEARTAKEIVDLEKNDLEDLDLEDLDLENLMEPPVAEKMTESKESGLEEVEFGESGFEEIALEAEETKNTETWEEKKSDEVSEPESEEVSEEELFPLPEDDEDLDAEFDLLSALLSDSVKSSRPDGAGDTVNRKK